MRSPNTGTRAWVGTFRKEQSRRKVIASTFVTLDGFMVGDNEDMSWVMNNFHKEMGDYAGDLMNSMDTISVGRMTYDLMVQVWPTSTNGVVVLYYEPERT